MTIFAYGHPALIKNIRGGIKRFLYIFNYLLYSDDDLEQVIHDIDTAVDKVKAWKAHIMRTVHQETAKTVVLGDLEITQIMLVIDWAMKFIPSCYRETQADWYGKKGRPWHVGAVISKNVENGELEVSRYKLCFIIVSRFLHTLNICHDGKGEGQGHLDILLYRAYTYYC